MSRQARTMHLPKIGEAPIAGWASDGGLVRAPTRWEGGGARSSSRTKGVRRLQSLGRSEVSGPIGRRHYRRIRPALRWTPDKEFVRLADGPKALENRPVSGRALRCRRFVAACARSAGDFRGPRA